MVIMIDANDDLRKGRVERMVKRLNMKEPNIERTGKEVISIRMIEGQKQ